MRDGRERPAWMLGLLLGWIGAAATFAQSPIQLRDMTSATGIRFKHDDGSTGKRYVVEPVASGLATFDYDGDGRIDVYFLTGGPLEGRKVDNPPTNALYRNLGGFRFADVTREAGVGVPGYAMGAAAADYDNDGWQDLYVSNFGPNLLYRNRGDGTFDEVSLAAGVRLPGKVAVGAGTAFLDADRDGNLDLYVANYSEFFLRNPSPLDLPGSPCLSRAARVSARA
jgi:hypothetical protein